MAAIEIRDVGKIFPGGSTAVDGVSLTVGNGERVAILGPSGSGKSTLLRMVAGLEGLSTGAIAIGGRDLANVAPSARDVAMVFQNQVPYPHLNVFENLAFGLRARRVAAAEVADRVGEMAQLLGLEPLLQRRPEALSGGEKQRIALGRALVRRPAALLLDEPFSSLDTPLRSALRETLAAIQERLAITTLIVTHDQAEAQALGHRVAIMNRGRLIQVGTARELYDRPSTTFVAEFLGDPPMNLVTADRGLQLGFRPESVRTNPPEPDSADFPLAGRCLRSEPKNADQVVLIEAHGQIVRARISGDRAVPPDAMLSWSVPAHRLAWFDAATGARVEA